MNQRKKHINDLCIFLFVDDLFFFVAVNHTRVFEVHGYLIILSSLNKNKNNDLDRFIPILTSSYRY
jgi:hypothetical protein